jgi:prepilin-type processing-associated H-X9-DG protein
MRQISLGFLQYTQDYDELVIRRYYLDATYSYGNWAQVIQPYIKNVSPALFTCPTNSNKVQTMTNSANYPGHPYVTVMANYAANERIVTAADFPLSAIDKPADKILLAEQYNSASQIIMSRDWCCTNTSYEGTPGMDNHRGWAGHSGMSNYVFMDGHVKALTPSQTNTAQMNRWGFFTDLNTNATCGATNGFPNQINCDVQSPGFALKAKLLEARFQ